MFGGNLVGRARPICLPRPGYTTYGVQTFQNLSTRIGNLQSLQLSPSNSLARPVPYIVSNSELPTFNFQATSKSPNPNLKLHSNLRFQIPNSKFKASLQCQQVSSYELSLLLAPYPPHPPVEREAR